MLQFLLPPKGSCHQKDGPLDLLALIANRACIHKSYRIIENKQFLTDTESPHTHTHTHTATYPRKVQKVQAKNAHLPGSLWKVLNNILPSCYLRAQLPNNLHVGADCLPLRILTGLGTPLPTGKHQKQRRWLGIHKTLRNT